MRVRLIGFMLRFLLGPLKMLLFPIQFEIEWMVCILPELKRNVFFPSLIMGQNLLAFRNVNNFLHLIKASIQVGVRQTKTMMLPPPCSRLPDSFSVAGFFIMFKPSPWALLVFFPLSLSDSAKLNVSFWSNRVWKWYILVSFPNMIKTCHRAV